MKWTIEFEYDENAIMTLRLKAPGGPATQGSMEAEKFVRGVYDATNAAMAACGGELLGFTTEYPDAIRRAHAEAINKQVDDDFDDDNGFYPFA